MGTYERMREFGADRLSDSLGSESLACWLQAVRSAVEAGLIPAHVVPTALALTEFTDKRAKDVWPSHETVGRRIGRHARTVGRHYAVLVSAGLLSRVHRFAPPPASVRPAESSAPPGSWAVRGLSNMTRFTMPIDVVIAARARLAMLRSAGAKKSAERRKNRPVPAARPEVRSRRPGALCRDPDCAQCGGTGFIDDRVGLDQLGDPSPVRRCFGGGVDPPA